MSQLIKANYDKLLVALAAAVLAVSAAWMSSHRVEITRLQRQPVAVDLAGAAYDPVRLVPPVTKPAVWAKPAAQSHGSGWLYEVFTPPVIYYNTVARSFTVTPPLNLAEGGTPFGLELLDVKLEPYRLQLAGYFGGPGDYLAAFVSPGLPETLLARSGRRFEQLGLTLKSFDVRKVEVVNTEALPVYDVAALAVLLDDKTGEEVVLDSRKRKLTDTPLAVLRVSAAGGAAPRTLHEGDTFADDTATYRIERIQLDPPEVVVAKQTPGLPLPETRILRPVGKDGGIAAKPAKAQKFPAPPKTGLATNGN